MIKLCRYTQHMNRVASMIDELKSLENEIIKQALIWAISDLKKNK